MKLRRLMFAVLALAGILVGLSGERHTVRHLTREESVTLNGPAFVAGAAVDSFMRKDGALYAVSQGPLGETGKDCKT